MRRIAFVVLFSLVFCFLLTGYVWAEGATKAECIQKCHEAAKMLQQDKDAAIAEIAKKDGYVASNISVIYYKKNPQSFILYAEIPAKDKLVEVEPKPVEVREKFIKWEVKNIKSTERRDFVFKLEGDEFDENSLYVGKIDPVNVIGAEKWEGEE